jgi:hypothetical protein
MDNDKPSFHETCMVLLSAGAMIYIFIKILFL